MFLHVGVDPWHLWLPESYQEQPLSTKQLPSGPAPPVLGQQHPGSRLLNQGFLQHKAFPPVLISPHQL